MMALLHSFKIDKNRNINCKHDSNLPFIQMKTCPTPPPNNISLCNYIYTFLYTIYSMNLVYQRVKRAAGPYNYVYNNIRPCNYIYNIIATFNIYNIISTF